MGGEPANGGATSQPFLSYSRADHAAAGELHNLLEQAGVAVYRDVESLRSGDRWLSRLQQALAQCSAFIVLVGHEGLQRWVAGEVEAALNRHLSAPLGAPRLPIHPLLLPGASVVDLGPFLGLFQALTWAPGQPLPENLAAELRQGEQARPAERGLLDGCPYLGLASFGAKDSKLFYGRRAETMAAVASLGNQRDGDPAQAAAGAGAGQVRWLQVEGHSGSGKSSLVMAGLLPMVPHGALWARTGHEHWCVLGPMVPGQNPVARLAEALEHGLHSDDSRQRDSFGREQSLQRGPGALAMALRDNKAAGTAFLLVIDQFEELFTLATAADREAFDALVARALQDDDCPLYLVSTVRSDFLDRMALLPGLSVLLNTRCKRQLLPTIGPDGLRDAIEGPALLAGLDVSEVTAAMLAEAQGEPGALPLVEHALTQLWHQRESGNFSGKLSGALFGQSGGLAGMLSSSADALLDRIETTAPKVGRIGALELLLRLTRINTDDRLRHSRQRVSRDEAVDLAGRGDAVVGEQVLQQLAGQRPAGQPSSAAQGHLRLVTVGIEGEQAFVDLIHETLVRARPAAAPGGAQLPYWPTLYQYIEANRDRDVLHQQLALQLDRWQRGGRLTRWMHLATWRQLLDGRRLRPARQSAEGRYLRLSRRVAAVQIGVLAVVLGTLLQGAWWATANNLPFAYAFVQPLWVLGWRPVPEPVPLPPGRFTMGCKPGRDVDAGKNCAIEALNVPAHEVVLPSPCAIGRNLVTFLEYDRFVWSMRDAVMYPSDSGWGRFSQPVINVSWHEAQAYAAWLTETTGTRYRLPTEAEWEYAARSGQEARYPWGDGPGDGKANCAECGKAVGRTTPVGSYPPNAFYLNDMAGNVWQWVVDKAEADDMAKHASRVLRGGSWSHYTWLLRAAYRFDYPANYRLNTIGFRVCRVSPIEKPTAGALNTGPLKR